MDDRCCLCFCGQEDFEYSVLFHFFFNDTATTEIYTLSLHDALPIFKMFLINSDRPINKDVDQVCGDNDRHQLLRFGLYKVF